MAIVVATWIGANARVAAASDNVAAATRLRAIAGEDFRIRETEHFTIAYDTSYDAVRPLIGRLEGSYKAIKRFCVANALDTRPLAKRLEVILFNDYDDFVDYSKRMEVPAGSIAGFYHHENNVAAFCNTLSSPDLRRLSGLIDLVRGRIDELRAEPAGNSTDDAFRHELETHLTSLTTQRDVYVKRLNRTVIQHEAAHQILFNMGVHVSGADNPPWLIEGLACQFEVPQPGPGGELRQVNEMRLFDVREALGVEPDDRTISDAAFDLARAEGRFLPLLDLIGEEDVFDYRNETVSGRYGQAWALVFYLHRENPQAFASYLQHLANRSAGVGVERDARIDEFRIHFGDPDSRFERKWIDFLLRLRASRP